MKIALNDAENAIDKVFNHPENYHIKGRAEDLEKSIEEIPLRYLVAGYQPKLLMTLDGNKLVPSERGEFIVKPSSITFPELAENEAIVMSLARNMGFDTASFALVSFECGTKAYATKRFDIDYASGHRFFIEDGASICDIPPEQKDNHDYSYEEVITTMANACEKPQEVKETCFKLVLFSYLVGNCDLHLKNFAFYRSPIKRSCLMDGMAPIYDLVSLAPYPDYDNCYLTLSLLASETDGVFSPSYEAYGFYTQADFLMLAEKLGIESFNTFEKLTYWVRLLEVKFRQIVLELSVPTFIQQALQQKVIDRVKMFQRQY